MEAMVERCAGLDVHQETVVACVLFGPLDKKPKKSIETFQTTTKGLLKLNDWLTSMQVTESVMESTGVYWKPVWNIEWLAKLLRSGLIEGSFVPPEDIRDLRDLTRYRKKLINNRTAEQNRIHKILQDANIKLTSVLSDIFGQSGREILEAIINGEKIEKKNLQKMVHGRVKASLDEIAEAINGRIRRHHRVMLRYFWEHMIYIEQVKEELEEQIDQCLLPYQKEIELLDTIPGVNKDAAAVFVAELGVDMSVFKNSSKRMASWVGVSPGNNESAGKKAPAK